MVTDILIGVLTILLVVALAILAQKLRCVRGLSNVITGKIG